MADPQSPTPLIVNVFCEWPLLAFIKERRKTILHFALFMSLLHSEIILKGSPNSILKPIPLILRIHSHKKYLLEYSYKKSCIYYLKIFQFVYFLLWKRDSFTENSTISLLFFENQRNMLFSRHNVSRSSFCIIGPFYRWVGDTVSVALDGA